MLEDELFQKKLEQRRCLLLNVAVNLINLYLSLSMRFHLNLFRRVKLPVNAL